MKKFNEIGMEDRCIVNGDTAIKPYYYMRNGLLHVRFTVDRCVELSKAEENQIKAELDLSRCKTPFLRNPLALTAMKLGSNHVFYLG